MDMSLAATTQVWFIWMTTVDGHDHVVTDEEMATSNGVYRTLCGARVLPAPLVDPPEPQCFTCLSTVRSLRAISADPAPPRRSRRRRHRRTDALFGGFATG
jgi:hypothetical protein